MLRIAVIAAALSLGCGKGSSDKSDDSSKPEAASVIDAAPIGPSKMHKAFDDAKKQITPLSPWDRSYATLVKLAGEPALVEENAYHWYTLDKGKCWELRVVRNKDTIAAIRLSPYPKAVKKMFARCQ